MRRLNLSGKKFGRLRVLRFLGVRRQHGFWTCRCECGNKKNVEADGANLVAGRKRSCGCLARETARRVIRKILPALKHGLRRSPEYNSWVNMKTRCSNRKTDAWRLYGARGIRVCTRWRRSFMAFYRDMGARPQGKTLDRRKN